jgi:hypothetical protein
MIACLYDRDAATPMSSSAASILPHEPSPTASREQARRCRPQRVEGADFHAWLKAAPRLALADGSGLPAPPPPINGGSHLPEPERGSKKSSRISNRATTAGEVA